MTSPSKGEGSAFELSPPKKELLKPTKFGESHKLPLKKPSMNDGSTSAAGLREELDLSGMKKGRKKPGTAVLSHRRLRSAVTSKTRRQRAQQHHQHEK